MDSLLEDDSVRYVSTEEERVKILGHAWKVSSDGFVEDIYVFGISVVEKRAGWDNWQAMSLYPRDFSSQSKEVVTEETSTLGKDDYNGRNLTQKEGGTVATVVCIHFYHFQ